MQALCERKKVGSFSCVRRARGVRREPFGESLVAERGCYGRRLQYRSLCHLVHGSRGHERLAGGEVQQIDITCRLVVVDLNRARLLVEGSPGRFLAPKKQRVYAARVCCVHDRMKIRRGTAVGLEGTKLLVRRVEVFAEVPLDHWSGALEDVAVAELVWVPVDAVGEQDRVIVDFPVERTDEIDAGQHEGRLTRMNERLGEHRVQLEKPFFDLGLLAFAALAVTMESVAPLPSRRPWRAGLSDRSPPRAGGGMVLQLRLLRIVDTGLRDIHGQPKLRERSIGPKQGQTFQLVSPEVGISEQSPDRIEQFVDL